MVVGDQKFTDLIIIIAFRLKYKDLIALFGFRSICFFVGIGFVLDVGLHCILAFTLENHLGLLKDVLRTLGLKRRRFLRTNFLFKNNVRNASVEHSTRLALNACVVGRVVVWDSNVDILVPH